MNKFHTLAPIYAHTNVQGFGNNYASTITTKIGGISKGNKIVSIQEQRDRIESQFMNISFKANRAQAQRDARRAKR